MPSPISLTVGFFFPSLSIVSVAACLPLLEGVNISVMGHVPFAAIGLLAHPDQVNCALLLLIVPMPIGTGLSFTSVSGSVTGVPTGDLPKLTDFGLIVSTPGVPEPLSVTLMLGLVALLVTSRCPVRLPAASGVNVTDTGQLAPAARVPTQLSEGVNSESSLVMLAISMDTFCFRFFGLKSFRVLGLLVFP